MSEPTRAGRTSAIVAAVLFGTVWALANIGGNFRGWAVIFAWLEASNGPHVTMDPVITHPLTLLLLAILPSAGQWWLQWFNVRGGWAWVLYAIMAVDLAINTVGFYQPVMGTFTFPPVWSVFWFLAGLATIPNIVCQGLATDNLKLALRGLRLPQHQPKPRRSNGAIERV